MDALFLSMRLHMRYLRSLEDSPRTRAACVAYLQAGLPNFLPRPDILAAARALAEGVGGSLQPPRVSWLHAGIARWCGRRFARRAQVLVDASRFSARQRWDRLLRWIEEAARRPGLPWRAG
jgi:hypothetical protein